MLRFLLEMMRTAIIIVIVLGFCDSQLTSCYNCIRTETDGIVDTTATTCPQSLTQSSNVSKCQGMFCLSILTDNGRYGYKMNSTCLPDDFLGLGAKLSYLNLDTCLLLNGYQDKVELYLYEDMCCFSTNQTLDQGSSFSSFSSFESQNTTVCACFSDYCNRDAFHFGTTPGPSSRPPIAHKISSGNWNYINHFLLLSSLILTAIS